jgi:hypothetical protein
MLERSTLPRSAPSFAPSFAAARRIAVLALTGTLLAIDPGTARAHAERQGCLTQERCETDNDCCLDCEGGEGHDRGRCWDGRCLYLGACVEPLDPSDPGLDAVDEERLGGVGEAEEATGDDGEAVPPKPDQLLEGPTETGAGAGGEGGSGTTGGGSGQVEAQGGVTVTVDADGSPVSAATEAAAQTATEATEEAASSAGSAASSASTDTAEGAAGCGGESADSAASGCGDGAGEAAGAACSGGGDAISCSVSSFDGQPRSAARRRAARAGNATLWSLVMLTLLAARRRRRPVPANSPE